ncbi:hypothetical protein QZN01_20800 [Burkholderia cenocepacia]|uniref:hypothetical protein n=1 Tax=Burkholderia cenocepacia TaxID=95486 RepID=UPI00264F7A7E|nr:hypothetical protein [Burkholderia cenocepacia]MDN7825095.1 hypothetical protein [Burkholderia cenocepacia]
MQRIPNVIAPQLVGNTAAPLYTAPAGTTTTIANLSFTNTSGVPVSVTVYNVPSGGTPGVSNELVSAYSIAAGQTYVPPQSIGLNLSAGSTLQALAGTAGVVAAQGGVYETSGS